MYRPRKKSIEGEVYETSWHWLYLMYIWRSGSPKELIQYRVWIFFSISGQSPVACDTEGAIVHYELDKGAIGGDLIQEFSQDNPRKCMPTCTLACLNINPEAKPWPGCIAFESSFYSNEEVCVCKGWTGTLPAFVHVPDYKMDSGWCSMPEKLASFSQA